MTTTRISQHEICERERTRLCSDVGLHWPWSVRLSVLT